MPAISIDNVTKRFGNFSALRNLDLTVEEGEIFGFLGPNGAGKSTTIDTLLDFVRPSDGQATVFGYDCQAESKRVREVTGVLPDGYDVYSRLTGRQHVEYRIDAERADDDPDAILERVGLADAADRKAGDYSKGMTQRLVLGMALVGSPDLLILDEPSTGLDPNGTRELRRIVREENERGVTVFFSSHSLAQVEAVCDRVGILRDGELVAVDTVDGLRATAGQKSTLHVSVDRVTDSILSRVEQIEGVSGVTADPAVGELEVRASDSVKPTILDVLQDGGVTVETFSTEETTLEEIFASYTGGGSL